MFLTAQQDAICTRESCRADELSGAGKLPYRAQFVFIKVLFKFSKSHFFSFFCNFFFDFTKYLYSLKCFFFFNCRLHYIQFFW